MYILDIGIGIDIGLAKYYLNVRYLILFLVVMSKLSIFNRPFLSFIN